MKRKTIKFTEINQKLNWNSVLEIKINYSALKTNFTVIKESNDWLKQVSEIFTEILIYKVSACFVRRIENERTSKASN